MLPQQGSHSGVGEVRSAAQLLKEGVAAFRGGDKERARELLALARELEPNNELAWMWSASTAKNRAEALRALSQVLTLNPENAKAKQWIERLRGPAKPSQADATPQSDAAPKKESAQPQSSQPAEEPAEEQPEAEVEPKAQADDRVEAEEEDRGESAGQSAPSQQESAAAAAAAALKARRLIEEAVRSEKLGEAEERPQAAGQAADPLPQSSSVHEEDQPERSEPESAQPSTQTEAESDGETETSPAADEPASTLPPPVQEKSNEDDDPIRHLLFEKGDPDAPPLTPKKAEVVEPLAPPSDEAGPVVSEERKSTQPAPAEDVAAATGGGRPISGETCLLCGKRSLTDGVCGYCKAVGDISKIDEISQAENVDRTVMLAAVERFRKELEAGPSFEANLGLALAYLNLKQSNDALPRLGEACRLQPDNAPLRHNYEQLRARKLILVVDDSRTVQKMIAGVLEKSLYRVALAEDGLQALARLDDEMPALILLDITMPRMDGYQVARIITGNEATSAIPVVMLSGKDGFFDRMRGKLAGAKDYVTKPFETDVLISTIERYVKT